MKLILISIMVLFLFGFGSSAYTDTLHGFEKSGGEYSIFHLEFDYEKILSGYVTIPNKEWNPIMINLIDPTFTKYNDGSFSSFSQNNKVGILINAQPISEKLYDVAVYLKFPNYPEPAKLEYWSNYTKINYDLKTDFHLLVENQKYVSMDQQLTIKLHVLEDGKYDKRFGLKDVSIITKISRGILPVAELEGKTNKIGYYADVIRIDRLDYHIGKCYDVKITANLDGIIKIHNSKFQIIPDHLTAQDKVYKEDINCVEKLR